MTRNVIAAVLCLFVSLGCLGGCASKPGANSQGGAASKDLSGLSDCYATGPVARGGVIQVQIGACDQDCTGFFHPAQGANDSYAFQCGDAQGGVVSPTVPGMPAGDYIVTCGAGTRNQKNLCKFHLDPVTGSSGGTGAGGGTPPPTPNPQPTPECVDNSNCASGKTCVNGQCLAQNNPPPQCTQDSDCAAGQTCQGGTCVTPPQPPQPAGPPTCDVSGTNVVSNSDGVVQMKWSCQGAVFKAYVYGPFVSVPDPNKQYQNCLSMAVTQDGKTVITPNMPSWSQWGIYANGMECKDGSACSQIPNNPPVPLCRVDVVDQQQGLNKPADFFYTKIDPKALNAQNKAMYTIAYRAKGDQNWTVKTQDVEIKATKFATDPTIELSKSPHPYKQSVFIHFACAAQSKPATVEGDKGQFCKLTPFPTGGNTAYDVECSFSAPLEKSDQVYTVTCPGFTSKEDAKASLKVSLTKAIATLIPGGTYKASVDGQGHVTYTQVCQNADQHCGDGGLVDMTGSVTRDVSLWKQDPQTNQWSQFGSTDHVPWVDAWFDFNNGGPGGKQDYSCSSYKEASESEFIKNPSADGWVVDQTQGFAKYRTKLFLQPNCMHFIFGLRKTEQMSVYDVTDPDWVKTWDWTPDPSKAEAFELDSTAKVGANNQCYGDAYADDPCDKFMESTFGSCDDLPVYHHKYVDFSYAVNLKGVTGLTIDCGKQNGAFLSLNSVDGKTEICSTYKGGASTCDLTNKADMFEKTAYLLKGESAGEHTGSCTITATFFDGKSKDQTIPWNCTPCEGRNAWPGFCHQAASSNWQAP